MDAAGNIGPSSAEVRVTVILDVTPPTFTISLSHAVIRAGELLTITVTASESLMEIPSVSVTQANRSAEYLPLEYVSGLTWRATYRVASGYDGRATVDVSARDFAGNLGTASATFTVDSVAPTISIDSPADRAVTRDDRAFVAGRTEPGATLTVNGIPVVVSTTGEFSTYVSLVEGENVIRLVARDEAGNEATATRTVIRDTIPPSINITSPRDGLLTNLGQIDVVGTTEIGATLKVNDIDVAVAADGSFRTSVVLVEGRNTIKVVSIDAAGNRTETSLTVISDMMVAKPTISVLVKGMVATIEGEIDLSRENSFPVKVIVYLQPEGADPRPVKDLSFERAEKASFKVENVLLEPGTNIVFASAEDAAGNRVESDRQEVVGLRPSASIVAARTTPRASNPRAGLAWKKNQRFVMRVHARNLFDAVGCTLVVKYDPSILKVDKVDGGAKFGVPEYTDDGKGTLTISVSVPDKKHGVTGNPTVVAITFVLMSEERSQTTLHLELAKVIDISGNEIGMDTEDGTVKVIKLLGDLNDDGRVNIHDLKLLLKYYRKSPGTRLPDGTVVPRDPVKKGLMVDDEAAGDGIWDLQELSMLAAQWGWDHAVPRAPDKELIDPETGRLLSPAFRGIGLRPERTRIAVGDTARVELWVDAAGMAAGEAIIEYDPTKLRFIGSVGADEIPFVNVSLLKSEIVIDFAPMGGAVGKVAVLTFKAIGAGYPGLKVTSSKMYDLAGNEIVGPVVEADLIIGSADLAEKEGLEILKLEVGNLYPNPGSGSVVVPILSPKGAMAEIAVVMVSGQVVKARTVALKPGVNQITLDLSGISPGTYRVVVKVDGRVYVRNLAVR